jgi:hypothetical protein
MATPRDIEMRLLTIGLDYKEVLRDYFMAHAPAKPTFDFDIRMSSPAPVLVEKKRNWFQRLADSISMGYDFGKLYENWSEYEKWANERDNQSRIQWPRVWAEAMMKERERSLT